MKADMEAMKDQMTTIMEMMMSMNKMMKELYEDFKIKHHNLKPYRSNMNDAVEVANKNIKKIIQKMIVTYKDWPEMLLFALHGYQTFVCTSTGETPFSLLYRM